MTSPMWALYLTGLSCSLPVCATWKVKWNDSCLQNKKSGSFKWKLSYSTCHLISCRGKNIICSFQLSLFFPIWNNLSSLAQTWESELKNFGTNWNQCLWMGSATPKLLWVSWPQLLPSLSQVLSPSSEFFCQNLLNLSLCLSTLLLLRPSAPSYI